MTTADMVRLSYWSSVQQALNYVESLLIAGWHVRLTVTDDGCVVDVGRDVPSAKR